MKSELKDNYGIKARYIQRYGNEVLKSNTGSILKIQVDRNLGYPIFKRFFICFASMRDGFVNGFMPFIGVDGCFLKGPFGGQLLTAISLDNSSGVFPIAMTIVELECTKSWTTHLETMIGSHNSDNIPWTFMSDRQKIALFLFRVFNVL
ncbi:hypothetical protein D8674_032639 [Pyrus ussuriensis x Pyrus communis]|uniref:MULE transposase domain-containing protein n=1 Tax=Pyrus ussuriensis x Pyrus communis TaxID=2448454 RepID=A0A5N5HWT5_9ROSA|nr:hypothetical protein D8674_032639 [Pyrus ussuriensis x Pyrus communis]